MRKHEPEGAASNIERKHCVAQLWSKMADTNLMKVSNFDYSIKFQKTL